MGRQTDPGRHADLLSSKPEPFCCFSMDSLNLLKIPSIGSRNLMRQLHDDEEKGKRWLRGKGGGGGKNGGRGKDGGTGGNGKVEVKRWRRRGGGEKVEKWGSR